MKVGYDLELETIEYKLASSLGSVITNSVICAYFFINEMIFLISELASGT